MRDGNLLWSADVDVARPGASFAHCSLRDVVALEQSPGVYDYVVVGVMGAADNTVSHDGCAFRVNDDGSVPWSRIYGEDNVQYFFGATLARDGAIAVVGEVLRPARRQPALPALREARRDDRAS